MDDRTDCGPASAPVAGSDSAAPALSRVDPAAEHADALCALLAQWMPRQRWFAGTSAQPQEFEVIGWADVPAEHPGSGEAPSRVLDIVVRRTAEGPGMDYQVPLVLTPRDAEAPADPQAEVGMLDLEGGPVRLLDATRTDAGRRALLELVVAGRSTRGEHLELDGQDVEGRGRGTVASTRLLSGEQSNSSMILEFAADASGTAPAPVIAKLFRVLQEGQNPDVILQGALDAAGSDQVAPLVGSARIAWGREERRQEGHALFVQEFFPGVEDAWRVALRDAVAGQDFSHGARQLGEATARVHRDLATHLGTVPADPARQEAMVSSMLARLDEAAAEVPAVQAAAPALRQVIARAREVAWPAFQRIHGDYHLGQVLAVPGRGWVLLDFEGEPMRSLAQRAEVDCPIRDVAGMLRSLDYVAGAVWLDHGHDASAWAEAARTAFCQGYAEVAGVALDDAAFGVLLAAFEADKAVYEALYEARTRPDWLPIPVGALERLAAS